jgi:hypothetical protein
MPLYLSASFHYRYFSAFHSFISPNQNPAFDRLFQTGPAMYQKKQEESTFQVSHLVPGSNGKRILPKAREECRRAFDMRSLISLRSRT